MYNCHFDKIWGCYFSIFTVYYSKTTKYQITSIDHFYFIKILLPGPMGIYVDGQKRIVVPPPDPSSDKIEISAVFRSVYLININLCSSDARAPSLFGHSISSDEPCTVNRAQLDLGNVKFYDIDVKVDLSEYPYESEFELYAVSSNADCSSETRSPNVTLVCKYSL